GERYILGGENLTLKQILDKLGELTGLPSPTAKVPHAVAMAFAVFDEFFTGALRGKEPRATVDAVRMGRKKMFASSAKAERGLGEQVNPGKKGPGPRHPLVSDARLCPACRGSSQGERMNRTIAIIAALERELHPLLETGDWTRNNLVSGSRSLTCYQLGRRV